MIDSLRNKANNATDEDKGFLVPMLRFLEGLFEALDSRRWAVMLGEFSAQFKEQVAFFSTMLESPHWEWSNSSHLLPDEYEIAVETLAQFADTCRVHCKFSHP